MDSKSCGWSDEWSGNWIWSNDSAAERNAYALFRRPFEMQSSGEIIIRMTADSHYLLHLDGRFIQRGPARAPLSNYQYDEYTFTLAPGPHCIAVLVHHVGEVNATMMLGRPGLLANAIASSSSRTLDLSSGPEWLCTQPQAWRRDLPKMMSHFGFWEELDLSKLPTGWMDASFTETVEWKPATVVAQPGGKPWCNLTLRDIALLSLVPAPQVTLVASGTWESGSVAKEDEAIPAKVAGARLRKRDSDKPALPFHTAIDSNSYLTIDFGRTLSGYMIVHVAQSAPGQIMEISFDEVVTPGGAVDPSRTYAHLTDRYILPGGDCTLRATHPRGFRYVTIDLAAARETVISNIEAIEETYPFELLGTFEASDSTLGRDYRKAAETIRISTSDAFMDCPTRERVQWMEDLYMHSIGSFYAFGDTRMTLRSLRQAAQCQLEDGRINGFFPSERDNLAFASSSLMWLLLLADYACLTDSTADLQELLPAAERLLTMLQKQEDAEGLIAGWPAGQFWEWAPIEQQGCMLLTNAAWALALDRLMAHPVLRENLPRDIPARIERIRLAAHKRFRYPGETLYSDAVLKDASLSTVCSQQANSMAVLAGICPAAARRPLMKKIIDTQSLAETPVGEHSLKERPADHNRIVPVGTLWFGQWLCRALFECELDTDAIAQMRMLWGAYADLPTFPEVRILKGNTGLCHGWASGPAYLLPTYVLGLKPASPGWRKVVFNPQTGDLANAEGNIPLPGGNMTAKWEKRDGRIRGWFRSETPVELQIGKNPDNSEACTQVWEGWIE